MSGRRVILIGMMGAGKSTIGRLLSRRTGWQYVDNDELVEQSTGRLAADLMATDGEEALHRAEREAFRLAASLEPPVIVGVAGAVVLDPDAHRELREATDVIWLRASPSVLVKRVRGTERRLGAESHEWMDRATADREALYRSAADITVDVDDRGPDEIVDFILDTLDRGPIVIHR